MPASRLRAALPGWLRAAPLALALTCPVTALAQDAPAPPAGGRPSVARPGLGLAPLQTEPGDIWAEVRSWTQPKKEAPERPAEGAAKPRRSQGCAAGEAGCARKPARTRGGPG